MDTSFPRRRVFADYARVEMPYVRLWLAERIWKKSKDLDSIELFLDKVNEDWMKIIRGTLPLATN